MKTIECETPMTSVLRATMAGEAYFADAYRAPLKSPPAGVVDIFFAVFGHHPRWMKAALVARNRVAAWCGLDAPNTSDVMNLQRRKEYKVGETIGVWPIYSLSETELVAGRNNRHLDFRLSILRELNGPKPTVVVSTVCVVHNRIGKIYLFFVVPFHKWGVKRIMANAVEAGRL